MKLKIDILDYAKKPLGVRVPSFLMTEIGAKIKRVVEEEFQIHPLHVVIEWDEKDVVK